MFYDKPMFFEKNRVARVYTGGKLFSEFFGDDSEDGFFPEEWVVSTVHALNEGSTDEYEGISKIAGTDIYLSDAVNEYKSQILGDRQDIGILTKILDSAIRLPVQAHPDKAFSAKYFNSKYGKEESWIILATRPGAKIYYGFKDGVTLEDFEKAIDESDNGSNAMEDLLCSIDVKVGDVIYIPAKMVHAIGYGCLLLEVQEPTDFTIQPERFCGDYRLSDNEMYIGLSRNDALGCFDIGKRYPAPLKPEVIENRDGLLYESIIGKNITESFNVRTVTLNNGEFRLSKGVSIYVALEGEAKIIGDGYEKEIKKGDYFFVPFNAVDKFLIKGTGKIAECFA